MNTGQDNSINKSVGIIIDGVPAGVCIFCGFMTSIDFDLDLHSAKVYYLIPKKVVYQQSVFFEYSITDATFLVFIFPFLFPDVYFMH